MRLTKLVPVLLPVFLAACSTDARPVDPAAQAKLTKAQKDSVLAASKVPGGKAVGSAMNAAAAANAQTARTDSVLLGTTND